MKALMLFSVLASASCFAGAADKAPAPDVLAKGKASFATNCVICHGEKGDGNGPAGQAMNPKPRDFSKDKFKSGSDVDSLFKTITNGLPGTSMVAFGSLPEDERKALAAYVKSFQSTAKK